MTNANDFEQTFIGSVLGITRHHVVIDGVVKSVDRDKFTCSVMVGGDKGSEFFQVPLKVSIGTRGSLIEIPVLNTDCLLFFRDGNLGRPQLLWADIIQDWLINCEGNVIFNEGELGGMVKVISLTEKLNNIENLLNGFIDSYNTHTHPVTATGSPTGVPVVPETGTLTPTERTDIENKKIQQ